MNYGFTSEKIIMSLLWTSTEEICVTPTLIILEMITIFHYLVIIEKKNLKI